MALTKEASCHNIPQSQLRGGSSLSTAPASYRFTGIIPQLNLSLGTGTGSFRQHPRRDYVELCARQQPTPPPACFKRSITRMQRFLETAALVLLIAERLARHYIFATHVGCSGKW